RRSVALAAPADNIEEPDALRRIDGSSVYTVAGADLYTSQRILDAEARLVTTAGRRDGSAVDQVAVDLALLEMAANGTALDDSQASLVRQMCTSGARLQLAIAPAGAGKTTAMRALALAWTQDGGQVLGLAPSAAAAAVLGEQTGIRTETLAKLTWSLDHGELPDWAAAVGPSILLIIDEAGMADTLSLDAAVQFAINRGASVRLVGDNQQLAAIGAGGVLRDITHTYGALHLTELHRFTDPAEATASLALRDGKPEALDFYLDHGRVHVGDIATMTEDAFSAWVSDRAAGLDTIMLAPTRKLVAELNRRAREHRLTSQPAGREVRLADGNQASVGDVIITRTNDRRLRASPTDFVRNGDRWTVTKISTRGDITVRHLRSQLICRLPADYVRTSIGLGYATTIHGAQDVSADTMHGMLTGRESRQQLYTMLTRGRHANHLYLRVVGDGDPQPDRTRHRRTTDTDRDAAPDPGPRRLADLSDHDPARTPRPRRPVARHRPALHRQSPRRRRTPHRTRTHRRSRSRRPPHPRPHRRTRLAHPPSPPPPTLRRNRPTPPPPPPRSGPRPRPHHRRRHGRRPPLATTHPRKPRPWPTPLARWNPDAITNRPDLGSLPRPTITTCHRARRVRPNSVRGT
ncbi:MAG TPA: AAA family ATPase, partial [Propionibacteriaceae bacterium]|nr:AAA family ATPase [Propionibacteriaceae bacterium]